jgi:hypothetical protein
MPHCGKDVLDHMTECPYCKGALESRYYTPRMDEQQQKKLKRTLSIIGFAIAAAIILFILIQKFGA